MSIRTYINKSSAYQGATVIFDQGLYSLTNFITGVLLARVLTKEDFGIYVLALSLILTIMGIQRAIISVPYTVYSQRIDSKELEQYTSSIFVHHLSLLIITFFICVVFARIFFLNRSESINNIFIYTAFFIAAKGFLIRDFVRSYLLSSIKIWESVILGTFTNIIQLIILFMFFFTEKLTVSNSFLIIGCCSILPAIFIFLKNTKIYICKKKVISDLMRNIKFGRWIFGSNVISSLSSQSYPWLLAFFADNQSVAVLGVTMALANFLGPIIQGFYAFILPKMSKARKTNYINGVIEIMKKAVIILLIFFSLWLICGIIFGGYLLEVIYTSKYSGYTLILSVLIANSLFAGISIPVTAALESLERSDISFKCLFSGFIVTVILGPFLVYKYQLNGAVVAILLSTMTSFLLRVRGVLSFVNQLKVKRPSVLGLH